ncbi:MAG: hypothetical protein ACP5NX_04630 [Candidatus Bilamarchaeaceae archaeon]
MAFSGKSRIGELEAHCLEADEFPEHTTIIRSKHSQMILYNPWMTGIRLQENMARLSEDFAGMLTETALKGKKKGSVAELVLLSGGLYYQLNHGFKRKAGYALPQCFLGIKRERIEGAEGRFRAVSTYENFEALPDEATIIIGDTIATGSTLLRSLNILKNAAEEGGSHINEIIIFSLACSTEGARHIAEFAGRFEGGVRLYACEQLFHLMPDGTDLRFFERDSVMPEETRKTTLAEYGEELGRSMQCAVFDWGTRCKNPSKHHGEFLAFCEKTLKDGRITKKTRETLEKMRKETEKEMASASAML